MPSYIDKHFRDNIFQLPGEFLSTFSGIEELIRRRSFEFEEEKVPRFELYIPGCEPQMDDFETYRVQKGRIIFSKEDLNFLDSKFIETLNVNYDNTQGNIYLLSNRNLDQYFREYYKK